MRKSNSSLLGKYSDGSYKRKGKKDQPAIVEYKQLYKGEIKAKTVTEKKIITLEDKINARNKPADTEPKMESAQVTIGGVQYLVRSGDAGYDRIMKKQRRTTRILLRIRQPLCRFSRLATGSSL